MAWRPPHYNENYGQYGQQPRPRGRGYSHSPISNSNGFTFGRGNMRERHELPSATMAPRYGRGRFPFATPQMAETSILSNYKTRPPTLPSASVSTCSMSMSNASGSGGMDHLHKSQSYVYHPQSTLNQQKPNEDALNKDLQAMESVWNDNKFPDKKSKLEALLAKLSSVLAKQSNPWESAYNYITMASDYEAAKTTTLSFQILLQFEKWVRSSYNTHAGDEEKFLTQDFRVQVLYATTGRHMAYFTTAVEAFKLSHPGNEYFLPLAKTLLLRDKLPEAAQVVSKLCLQSHFSRDEILIPLLLTDRVNLIESYIKGDNQQQMLVLNLLDYLCARNTDIVSFAQSTGLKNIKAEKLSKKSLSKFAMRLIKMFDVPPEMCPNISENRAMSTVRFLLYKHYIEKSMTDDCWDDMIESVIGSNLSLQQQFILELMYYNDVKEAMKWVDRYQLPDTVLDPSVVEAKKNYVRVNEGQMLQGQKRQKTPPSSSISGNVDDKKPSADVGNGQKEDWDREMSSSSAGPSATYYSIPLREEDIVLVDTRDKLMSALDRLTRPSTVIGMDCEWKPIGPSKQVALLQLAVNDRVFLVDFIQLDGLVSQQDWRHFAHSMFCDDKILKIGYGLDTDLRMLSSSYPSMKEPLLKKVRVVELSKLAKTVDDLIAAKEDLTVDHTDVSDAISSDRQGNLDVLGEPTISKATIGFPHKNEEKGLSLLVKKIIGKPLCKDEQMSNWEKRPLRRSQILYAAMDAYVLVEIHHHLLSQAHSLGMDDQGILEPSVIFKTKTRLDKKKQKINTPKKSPIPSSSSYAHVTTSCRPNELRVVCDSMLQGLGNQLRSCGVDTQILSTGQLHDDAVQVALRENRIILTTGLPYEQVRSRVGDAMCYCVSNTIKSKDQCLDVLRHFKVEVSVDDIFSRCAVCNRADFAHIPSVDMEKLYVTNLQRQHQQHQHHHYHHQHPHHYHHQQPLPPAVSSYHSSSYQYTMDPGLDPNVQQSFLSKYGVDVLSLTFVHNGVRLQIETISSLEAFQTIDLFYACVGCGKVYWKGSHFDHIREQFKPVLTINAQPSGPTQSSSQSLHGPPTVADVVVGKMNLDAHARQGEDSSGGVGGGADFGEYYYDEQDLEVTQNDLENFSLQDAGFSGVWKIN